MMQYQMLLKRELPFLNRFNSSLPSDVQSYYYAISSSEADTIDKGAPMSPTNNLVSLCVAVEIKGKRSFVPH